MRSYWRSSANKYNNTPIESSDGRFDSKREFYRWHELKTLEKAEQICSLNRQVSHDLEINGERICRYVADFEYFDRKTQKWVTEDAKGVLTDVYKLKKKLMKALKNIEIQEV